MSLIRCETTEKMIDLDTNSEHQERCETCGNITAYEDYLKNNWVAYRGDYDLGVPMGRGSTKQEAIDDLVDEEEWAAEKRSRKDG
jgi:hypothetical protein